MSSKTIKVKIQLKTKTKEQWTKSNDILLKGELGIELDTRKFKAGDGETAWNNLKYAGGDNVEIKNEEPTTKSLDFDAGKLWLVNSDIPKLYILLTKSEDSATWIEIPTASGKVESANKLATPRKITLKGAVVENQQSFDGSNDIVFNLVLKTSGVTAGAYTKLTVNDQGIITAGETLTAEDIPNLPLSKIIDLGTAASKNVGAAAGNIPILDSNGKLDASVIPALAITDTTVVANEEEMLALNAQPGDIAIRSDENKTYILTKESASQLENWQMLKTPDCKVLSVNGKTGAVSLTSDDIEEGVKNLYFTEERASNNFKTNIAKTNVSALQDGADVLMATDSLILDGGED